MKHLKFLTIVMAATVIATSTIAATVKVKKVNKREPWIATKGDK